MKSFIWFDFFQIVMIKSSLIKITKKIENFQSLEEHLKKKVSLVLDPFVTHLFAFEDKTETKPVTFSFSLNDTDITSFLSKRHKEDEDVGSKK